MSCDLCNSVRSDRQLGDRLRFLYKRCSLNYGRLDLSCYQLIGAYFAVLEDMRFAEQYLQYSRQASDVINRQDQKRLGTELPANSRFNPCSLWMVPIQRRAIAPSAVQRKKIARSRNNPRRFDRSIESQPASCIFPSKEQTA